MTLSSRNAGFTVLELLISLAIAAMLLTAMAGLVDTALNTRDDTRRGSDALQDARFAMQRMIEAARNTERLLVPLADNPNTNWREHVREQTVPASPPEGDSTLATAVLAVTLDPEADLNEDGIKDGDNDGDGRVDEDTNDDNTEDRQSGIIGIDDNGNGAVDEGGESDNDEDGVNSDDPIDGIDNDGDGSIDEDFRQDNNGDGAPGIAGVDDDNDGSVDEGNMADDDEDGLRNEDWLDVVAFYLNGSTLIERRPNFNAADGIDFTEHVIAENVTRFRVERIPDTGKRAALVDLTLELTPPGGLPVSLTTRVRVGGAR